MCASERGRAVRGFEDASVVLNNCRREGDAHSGLATYSFSLFARRTQVTTGSEGEAEES